MEIIYQGHHAEMPAVLRQRIERGLKRLDRRSRMTLATVRFEEDGPDRRVEITLHLPRGRHLVSDASARSFGVAVTGALTRLDAQVDHAKRTPRSRGKSAARA